MMQRTWTKVGKDYARPLVEKAIDRLHWRPAGSELPMLPGEGIKAVIRDLHIPFPDRVAISSELAPLGLYGIESRYKNGLARVYVVDAGSTLVPVASDFEERRAIT